jgi:hypothetical protein
MQWKKINMIVRVQPRKPGPITEDEKKQLAFFYEALIDLRIDYVKQQVRALKLPHAYETCDRIEEAREPSKQKAREKSFKHWEYIIDYKENNAPEK